MVVPIFGRIFSREAANAWSLAASLCAVSNAFFALVGDGDIFRGVGFGLCLGFTILI
jgi:hypothetical protein